MVCAEMFCPGVSRSPERHVAEGSEPEGCGQYWLYQEYGMPWSGSRVNLNRRVEWRCLESATLLQRIWRGINPDWKSGI